MPNPLNLNTNSEGKFIVYSSSAGSGKTYTLTRFFIKLLLSQKDPKYFRTIVAITFTNKAANEMKERIFENLILLAEDFKDNSDENRAKEAQNLLDDYAAFIGLSKEEIKVKSKLIVSEILHNYSDLTVQTIDKFTHKIIRPFAKDLDISPDFNIELNEDDILTKSIDVLLEGTGKDELLTKVLIDFAEFKIDEGKRYQDFERDISELCQVFKKEDAIKYIQGYKEHSVSFFFDKKEELKKQVRKLSKEIENLGKVGLSLMADNGVSVNDFYQSKSGVGALFQNIYLAKFPTLNSYHLKAIEEDIWYTKSSTKQDEIDGIKDRLRTFMLEYVEFYKHYKTTNFIYARIFPTALLNEVEKLIVEVKEKQNILTLSDFNKMISALINSSYLSVPFLYERIGERYNHYLIDEFQDTSVLQWNNLLPLVDDSLAKGKENLIVGDGKQAIYRWRNGDVEQFVKLPALPHKPNENYNFIEDSLKREFNPDSLNTNYRSYSNIIEFNNVLFEQIRTFLNPYHDSIYKDVSQLANSKKGGYVYADLIDNKDYDGIALENVVKYVDRAISNGFEQKDICIIVRGNKVIKPIAELLIQNNFEVVSDESLRLTSSQDIKNILSFMFFINDQKDHKAAVNLAYALFPNHSPEEKHKLIKNRTLWGKIQADYNCDNSLFNLPIFELLNVVSKCLMVNQNSPYFIQFKNFLWNRFRKDSSSLNDFVSYWKSLEEKEMIPSLKSTDVANAVRIMTIHKSKGLQFPVVILPNVSWKTKISQTIKWVEPSDVDGLNYLAATVSETSVADTPFEKVVEAEQEETLLEALNMLYVALTRAEEQLYLCVNVKTSNTIGEVVKRAISTTKWSSENQIEIGESKRISQPKKAIEKAMLELNLKNRTSKVELRIAPESDKFWGESDQKELDYGNIFHYQISKVKSHKDLPKVIKSMKEDLGLNESIQLRLENAFLTMLKIGEIGNIFSDDNVIYNEQEISYNSQTLRIDKLVITPAGEALILDYKTGEEANKNVKQVRNYIEALQFLGFEKVKGFLYYTKNKLIQEVN